MPHELTAIWTPYLEPVFKGYLQDYGEFFIARRSSETAEGQPSGSVSVKLTRGNDEIPEPNSFFASIRVFYDSVDVMRLLFSSGFMDTFEKIKASTFYDVLQCLSVSGIGCVSHERDLEVCGSRRIYNILMKD